MKLEKETSWLIKHKKTKIIVMLVH